MMNNTAKSSHPVMYALTAQKKHLYPFNSTIKQKTTCLLRGKSASSWSKINPLNTTSGV
jgi:hypothetical protein